MPVEILVVDAETNEPISSAEIEVRYKRGVIFGNTETAFVLNVPEDRRTTTDDQGKATLKISNFKNEHWEVSAPGYFSRHEGHVLFGSPGFVPAKFRSDDQDNGQAVIRMYQDRKPTYTVIVPDGYEGPILVEEVAFENGVPDTIGQREFEYPINQNGYVKVNVVPFAHEPHNWIDIQFQYENGEPIPREKFPKSPDGDIVLRDVTMDVYVLGTAEDYSKVHRRVHHYIDGDPSHISTNHNELARLFDEAKVGEADQLVR